MVFGMTSPTPESAPLLEQPPPPVQAPPTTATPPPPPPQSPSTPTPMNLPPVSDALVMLGGLMILGFSFAPFVSYRAVLRNGRFTEYATSPSAWEWTSYLAPLTWFVVLSGLFLLALGLSRALSGDRLLFTFRTSQLQLLVAGYAASILIGYALTEKSLMTGATLDFMGARMQVNTPQLAEFGWGGVLMLIGSLIALIGALLNLFRLPAFARPSR